MKPNHGDASEESEEDLSGPRQDFVSWCYETAEDEDVCVHGRSFSVICVECCPEDDDGSFEGDEWSEA